MLHDINKLQGIQVKFEVWIDQFLPVSGETCLEPLSDQYITIREGNKGYNKQKSLDSIAP